MRTRLRQFVNINQETRCLSHDNPFHFGAALGCNKPLGMQDGTISDGQISASSERRLYFGPENARLNFSGTRMRVSAWVARKRDRNPWLQVDFGNVTIVTGIDTQGRASSSSCGECHDWVKNYTVSYSQDNATFYQYRQDGRVKVQCWEIIIVSVLSVLWVSWLVNICFSLFSQLKAIPGQLRPRLHRPSCVESPRCGAVHPYQSDRLERFHRHESGVPGMQNRFGFFPVPASPSSSSSPPPPPVSTILDKSVGTPALFRWKSPLLDFPLPPPPSPSQCCISGLKVHFFGATLTRGEGGRHFAQTRPSRASKTERLANACHIFRLSQGLLSRIVWIACAEAKTTITPTGFNVLRLNLDSKVFETLCTYSIYIWVILNRFIA